ncbi:hypothetical protein LCGC14_3140310, partial [marine sediment metagenome]
TMSLTGNATSDLETAAIKAEGTLSDLRIGQPDLDRLLAGRTEFAVDATKDGMVIDLDGLRIENPQIVARGSGQYAPQSGRVEAELELSELSQVVPELSGPATVTLDATGADGLWQVTLDGDGAGVTVAAEAELTDLDQPVKSVAGTAKLGVADLSGFSRLTGRELGGSLNLTLDGTATSDLSRADVTARGALADLQLGQPDIDRLLRGVTALDAQLRKSGQDIVLPRFEVTNPQITATGEGRYSPQNGQVTADVTLADLGEVLPELSGPGNVTLNAVGESGVWNVVLDGDGAGIALGADVEQVNVTGLDEGTFFADLILGADGDELSISSRPSTAALP